jgi:SOS-response transcriptional repressor LexA
VARAPTNAITAVLSTWKTLSREAIVGPLATAKFGGPVDVTERLRELRKRAGLSQELIAKKVGLKGQSSYQRYENTADFQKAYLPTEFVEKLIPVLQGRGIPPIELAEILALSGLSATEIGAVPKSVIQSIVPKKTTPLIPILRWRQVESWINRQLGAEDIEMYTGTSPYIPGINSFVLQIRDNSMSPDNINAGDNIVCDPDKPYQPGLIVLALISDQEEPVIGKYLLRKDRQGELITEIAPSNAAWPTHIIDRDHPGRIIAKIVEHRRTF